MKLKDEQIESLQSQRDAEFIAGVARDLRANLAAETARFSDAELERIVRRGIARARAWGLTLRYALALFVEMMFILSPGFDRHPSVRAALSRRDGHDAERIDAAVNLSLTEIAEARRLGTDADWGLDAGEDA